MKDLHIYTMADDSYLTMLNDTIFPLLPPSVPTFNIIRTPKQVNNLAGNTHNADYRDLMMFRLEKYLEILKRHEGEQVVFLDADVVIYGDFIDDLKERLEEKDFLAQHHTNEKTFCAGIMAFNSNERTIQFWKEAVAHCAAVPFSERQPGFPETELNEALGEGDQTEVEWFGYLPDKYGYICKDSYMYHGVNGGNTVAQKRFILRLADAICAIVREGNEETSSNHIPFYSSFEKTRKKVITSSHYAFWAHPNKNIEEALISGKTSPDFQQIDPVSYPNSIDRDEHIVELMGEIYPDGYYLVKNFKFSWAPHNDILFAYEITTKTLMVNTTTLEAASLISLGEQRLGSRPVTVGVIDYPIIYSICNGAIRK